LLGILPVAGKVVVGDAMFRPRDLAEKVVEAGGDYLLVVKDNRESLRVDFQAAFGDTARGLAAATSHSGPPFATPTAGAGDDHRGQGARAGGGADDSHHDGAHQRVEVAGVAAGHRIAA